MRSITAILLTFAFAALAFGQNEQAPITEKGFAYKDWTYKSVSGDAKVNLRDFAKGKKLVMVVYWAPWCPNWEHDLAFVQGLHDKYKGQGLGVIGVGEYDSVSKMRGHIEKNKLTFPMVYESDKTSERLSTVHYKQRTEAGDTRKWGSPWYVFLDPATLVPSGETLTQRTTVVNGELMKADAEQFIQKKLATASASVEVCDPDKRATALMKP